MNSKVDVDKINEAFNDAILKLTDGARNCPGDPLRSQHLSQSSLTLTNARNSYNACPKVEGKAGEAFNEAILRLTDQAKVSIVDGLKAQYLSQAVLNLTSARSNIAVALKPDSSQK